MAVTTISVSSSVGRINSAADVDEEMGNTNISSSRKEDTDSSPEENKDPSPPSKDDDFPVNSSFDHLEKDLDAVSLDVHGQ